MNFDDVEGNIRLVISKICLSNEDELLTLKKELESMMKEGYYEGDGDGIIAAALKMVTEIVIK